MFRNAAVVIEEYDGISDVRDYKLDRIPVWARIMGIPEGLMKNKTLAEKVARKVGVPPIKVVVNEGRLNPARYLRARVFLMLDTPLVRFAPLTLKEKKKYAVEYEKLPDFCDFCGLIGHTVTECGDGIHKPEQCEWGEWLLVNFDNSGDRGGPGMSFGRGGATTGRGAGFGRGRGAAGEANQHDNMDLDPRANHEHLGGDTMHSARQRLIGQDGTVNKERVSGTYAPPPGFVSDKVYLLENIATEPVDKNLLSTPEKIQDQKRQRSEATETNNDTSATSREEDRRTQ